MSELIIRTELLKIIFDVAVESLDFDSGFLCNEEVEALREIAIMLEIDPDVGTPHNFKCQYGYHDFMKEDLIAYNSTNVIIIIKKGECSMCRKIQDV